MTRQQASVADRNRKGILFSNFSGQNLYQLSLPVIFKKAW